MAFAAAACLQDRSRRLVVISGDGAFLSGGSSIHFATDFRDIPFHAMFEGLGGYGERVERRADLVPAIERALASGKTACVNVRTVGHISPIVLATTSKRDKASIE